VKARQLTRGPSALARERGQALVEFVLILPVFLLIVFGVVEFGRAFNYWIDVTHLANEGSRYAAVNRWPSCPSGDDPDPDGNPNPCDETLKDYLTERANTDELASGGTQNVPDALNVDICFPESEATTGKAVRVTVHTDYTLAVVDGLFGAIGLDGIGEIGLSASSTMRLERTPSPNRVLAEAEPASEGCGA
jgi:Flp pilus assembly protein TadG